MMRQIFYWPHMPKDVYVYFEAWPDCQKHRLHPTHLRLLKLFPPNGLFKFVAMDIFGPLPKTKNVNRLISVITDRF